jgi:iron complex outermembrane receptor protein
MYGVIEGHAVDADGAPVPGAVVAIEGLATATTDTNGAFRLRGISPGAHRLVARRLGYHEVARWVSIGSGAVVQIELRLAPVAVAVRGVTVIGTREELEEVRSQLRLVPGSVALIEPEELATTRQANFHDVLRFTPGVWVQPRQGAADESQLSIRGSGLRNNFHLRGINLLVNGMAYRNADGFTDFESLELLTANAIQVYKGGNALRYGGSTLGGAINLETKTGHTARPLSVFGQGGSHGFWKTQLSSGSVLGNFDYYASYARTSLDGYRDWSDQQRDRLNLHAGILLSPTVDLRAFYFFADVDEHLAGSLTRAQFESDETLADPNNRANRWGRDYRLHHLGLQLRGQLTPTQRIEIAPYFQYRDIDHPIFRVLAQVSRDFGAEIRYESKGELAGHANRLTVGFQPTYGNTDNRHYDNVAGAHGALRKNQKEEVLATAVYLEDVLDVSARLALVAGLRYDVSERRAEDFFLSDGDQSGTRTFRALMPKVGALYRLPAVRGEIYANVSRSYEPPLLLELNSLTVPGFVDVRAQDAWQFELGTRGQFVGKGAWTWDASVYHAEIRNEILNMNVEPYPGAGFTVPTYRNAARTSHRGLELGIEYEAERFGARLSYTWARYRFERDASFSGNVLPGAPAHTLQAELRYEPVSGFSITPTLELVPRDYFVDSENITKNDGWMVMGVRAEWVSMTAGLTLFAAAQNLTDRRYSPSVQVDNAAGRFFESGDRRTVYAGLRWQP